MYRIDCPNEQCGLRYHFDGTLKATSQDLSHCDDTRNQIRQANSKNVRLIALFWKTWGVDVKDFPIQRRIDRSK